MEAKINVTPLVDIVLVVLIIFMIATPVTVRELAAQAPAAISTRSQVDQPLLVGFHGGVLSLAGRPVSEAELVAQVRARSNRPIVFDVDADAAYGLAVHLMDLARGAGARTIALAPL